MNERGYVTEFCRHLSPLLRESNLYPDHTILETEVQKRRYDHFGVTQRPDLLIHIPIETGLTDQPNENNFVVYAFKRNGNLARTNIDFSNLDEMFRVLNYEIGIYINIGRFPEVFLHNYEGIYKTRIHEFSIGLDSEREVQICHSFFINDSPELEIL
jgi:hypothetical protein